jgi:hypothetical protein
MKAIGSKLLLVAIIISMFSTFVTAVQPTQQFNKIYLSPFYVSSMAVNTNVSYTVAVNPPDGITRVINAIVSFNGQINGQTQTFTLWVNNQSCNTPTYSVATAFSTTGNVQFSFDCSNIITKAGTYSVTMKSAVNTGAMTGWLDLTYMNNPPGSTDIFGTEYTAGQAGTIFLQLQDNQGLPVNNGACYVDIYYPNIPNQTHPIYLQTTPMVYKTGSVGLYYYDLTIPSYEGVYMLSAQCSYAYNWVWIYPATEQVFAPTRVGTTGTWTGALPSVNNPDDGTYDSCQTASNCVANYTFNLGQYGAIANISNLSLYFLGEGTKAGTVTFSYWNGTAYVALPNTLTLVATGSVAAPSGIDQLQTNVLPLAANRSGTVTIQVSEIQGSTHAFFVNWLSIGVITSTGTIQNIKGSSEIHVSPSSAGTLSNITATLNTILLLTNQTNTTVTTIYSYLQNTVYPAVDTLESSMTSVLSNQSIIYNKLLQVQTNITNEYQSLEIAKQYIINTNSTLFGEIINANSSIIAEINANEAKLDIINNTVNLIYNNLQTIVNPALSSMQSNITLMQQKLDNITIKINNLNVSVNMSGINVTATVDLSPVMSGLSNINTTLLGINSTFTGRFNTVDSSLSNLQTDVNTVKTNLTQIINRLDCVYSPSVICNRLSEINSTLTSMSLNINNINSTANIINSYLQTNVTPQLNTIQQIVLQTNLTVTGINSYLTSTVYPAITGIQTSVNNVLANQTTIYTKLSVIQTNITNTYNQLLTVQTMLSNVNSTLISEINQNEAKLDIINTTVNLIYNETINSVKPSLASIQSNISLMQQKLDNLTTKVNSLNFTTTVDLTPVMNGLSNINTTLLGMNSTFTGRFNTLDSSVSNLQTDMNTVKTNLTQIINRLDCTYSPSIICNRLSEINSTLTSMNVNVNNINSSVNTINTYLLTNITPQLTAIQQVALQTNLTVAGINTYLTSTVYPAITNIQTSVGNILLNQTTIYDKLTIIQTNITANYNQLNVIQSMLSNVNSTLISEINQNEALLLTLNITTTSIQNKIDNNVLPALSSIQSNLTSIQTTLNNLNVSVDLSQVYSQIQSTNSTINDMRTNFSDRFDSLAVSSNSIKDQVDKIEWKLDCNNSINITCDKLNAIQATLNVMNNNITYIRNYLDVNVTADSLRLYNAILSTNTTSTLVYNYLTTTINPSIVALNNTANQILNNQTIIFSKLIEVQQNVTNIYSTLSIIQTQLTNVNSSIINEINQNEAILLSINSTVNLLYSSIQTQVIPQLTSITNNITLMQSDLSTIINYVDSLEAGQTSILNNLTIIRGDLFVINGSLNDISNKIDNLSFNTTVSIDLASLNSSIMQRFNDVDSSISSARTEIGYIEAKLDCNHTTNIVCDILNRIDTHVISTNSTATSIYSYLTTDVNSNLSNIYNLLANVNSTAANIYTTTLSINTTVGDIYNYLQNNISPSISTLDGKINDVLNNQSSIYSKLVVINNDVITNYNELQTLKYYVTNINQTLLNEINENQQYLIEINSTTYTILDRIDTVIIPIINDTYIIVNDIKLDTSLIVNYTDTLEYGQQTIINDLVALNMTIDALNLSLSQLHQDILSINSTVDMRFNEINNTIMFVKNEVTNIEAKLDCNYTTNIVCDKLDSLDVKVDALTIDVGLVQAYLNGTIVNYLYNMNNTVTLSYDLLRLLNISVDNLNDTLYYMGLTLNSVNTTVNGINVDLSGVGSILNIVNNTIFANVYSTKRVVATQYYKLETTFKDINGERITPDNTPTIILYDPLNNVIVSGVNMTFVSTGVYSFSYNTSTSSNTGNWMTFITASYNNNTFYQYDHWNLISNPTFIGVDVYSVCDDEVCAKISIKNEGTEAYEYIYYWWTTPNAIEDYNGAGVLDLGQSSKLIQPGETYVVNQCLDNPHIVGQLYYRTKVYYGEYSYATDSFTINDKCQASPSQVPPITGLVGLEPGFLEGMKTNKMYYIILAAVGVGILLMLITRRRDNAVGYYRGGSERWLRRR